MKLINYTPLLVMFTCLLFVTSCESNENQTSPFPLVYEYIPMYQTGNVRTLAHCSLKNIDDDANVIYGHLVETVIGDTLIEDKECKIIEREYFTTTSGVEQATPSNVSYSIIYEELVNPSYGLSHDGAKIYEYIDGSFILKYDFTLSSGDKYKTYNVKTHEYEETETSMKRMEAISVSLIPLWRVTFDESDCFWVEGVGANYGDGMIYDPDINGYLCFESMLTFYGVTIDYETIKSNTIYCITSGRPWDYNMGGLTYQWP